MIIGVDGNEANVKERVGVSVYTLSLLRFFKERSNNDLKFVVFLRDEPLSHLPAPSSNYSYEIVKARKFWLSLFLPLHLFLCHTFKNKLDVFFAPAHYSPFYLPTRLVVTIHDLSYLYFPNEFLRSDLYKLKKWTKSSLLKAKKIIAVSKTTKKDVEKEYPFTKGKVEVVYNGYEKENLSPTSPPKKWSLKKQRFLLFVGTIQPRKNIEVLLDAYKEFKLQFPEFKLILVGKKGWLFDKIFRKIREEKIKDVIFAGYLDDNVLAWLYKNAFCYVLPSLYEGFGIPVLEAMSYGFPSILSFSSSLPEVAGDAALYFDPSNYKDLLRKLLLLKNNLSLRKELVAKGKKRVKLFSWEKTGERTLEILREVADDKTY